MIRLSGKRPDEDIAIDFVGVRPGEKLHEELWNEGEQVVPTAHPKILARDAAAVDAAWLEEELDELERLVDAGDTLRSSRCSARSCARRCTLATPRPRARWISQAARSSSSSSAESRLTRSPGPRSRLRTSIARGSESGTSRPSRISCSSTPPSRPP